jgi:hypothetical protein
MWGQPYSTVARLVALDFSAYSCHVYYKCLDDRVVPTTNGWGNNVPCVSHACMHTWLNSSNNIQMI